MDHDKTQPAEPPLVLLDVHLLLRAAIEGDGLSHPHREGSDLG